MSIYVKNGILHVSGAQDKLRQKGQEIPDFLSNYTMLDIETTGLSPYRDRITELGAVKVRNGQIVDQYTNLIKFPKNNKVPAFITKLNGITEEQIVNEGIFRNPVQNKNIVLSGHIHMDKQDADKMIGNMGGKAEDKVNPMTNYLIMGDYDFFRKDNEDLNTARDLIKDGAKIKRLSESFFLGMLDDWARS